MAADCTIAELHQTIQLAMGWTDEHLHRFTIRGQWYGVPREGGLHFFAGTHRLRLAEFDFRAHESFRYEYDFHSDWVHDIRVEKILPRASVRHVPVCIAGVGRCPPEDSGPPDRFMATLDEHSGFDFMTWLEDELERVDANSDGVISKNEANSDPSVRKAWKRLDKDKDGQVIPFLIQ